MGAQGSSSTPPILSNAQKAGDALNPNVKSGSGFQLPPWLQPGKTGTGGQTVTHQADGTDANPVLNLPDAYGNYQHPGSGGGGFSPGGWPDFPGLGSTVEYVNGVPKLKDGLSMQGTGITGAPVDAQALNALQARALDKNGSAWLGMMNTRADAYGTGMKDAAALDTQTAMTGAMDNAALRGGLTGGGSARIAGRSAVAGVNAQQGANKWLADAKLGNNIEDERQKLEIQKVLPGMQLDVAKHLDDNEKFNAGVANFADAKNIDTLTGGVSADNSGKLQKYGDEINKLIGDSLGQSMANGGKRK